MTEYINNDCLKIEDLQFKGRRGLTRVIVPESVKSIGYEAFGGCRDLEIVELAEGLTEIGKFAFSNCSSLCEIKIPSTVKSIGTKAFEGCSSLNKIIIDGDLDSIGIRYVQDNTRLQRHVAGGVKDRLSFREKCPALRQIKVSDKMSHRCIEMLSDAIDYTYCNSPAMLNSYIQGIVINLSIPCTDSYKNRYNRWLENNADRLVEKYIAEDDMKSMLEYEPLLLPHIHIEELLKFSAERHNVAFSAYLIEKSKKNQDSDLL